MTSTLAMISVLLQVLLFALVCVQAAPNGGLFMQGDGGAVDASQRFPVPKLPKIPVPHMPDIPVPRIPDLPKLPVPKLPNLPEIDYKHADLLTILHSIRMQQQLNDTEYAPRKTYPPLFHWSKQKGLYDSFVHVNFHGEFPLMVSLRRGYKFPDDNAFVTLFIAHALADVQLFLPSLGVQDKELLRALEAIATHRDKNSLGSPVPVYSFWNQVPVNTTDSNSTSAFDGTQYRASPPNIEIPLAEATSGLAFIKKGLAKFHLDQTKLGKIISTVVSFTSTFGRVFNIPPDSDDTGVNLALGAQLNSYPHLFANVSKFWNDNNPISSGDDVIKTFSKYAYRPFDSKSLSSAIDPRTYFWIRSFLDKEKSEGRASANLALITTWMQSIDEIQEQIKYKKMPFNVNNVDASVTANSLYGILSYFVQSSSRQMTVAESNFVLDNARLLAHVIENRLVEKYPSVVLLYYPSKYAFYWFTSRIVHLMSSNIDKAGHGLTKTTMASVLDYLQPAMQLHATQILQDDKQCDSVFCHWDDFLGNGDKFRNETKRLHEDRVFSTAMVLNTLIDSWTVRIEAIGGQYVLDWYSDTPISVYRTIERAHNWLKTQAWLYPKENAFFSGSIKVGGVDPFSFPHNNFMLINGTSLGSCSKYSNVTELGGLKTIGLVSASVRGYVDDAQYSKLTKNHVCFGNKFPEWAVTASLNCDKCVFPYWSSPALTESIWLLGQVKFLAIRT